MKNWYEFLCEPLVSSYESKIGNLQLFRFYLKMQRTAKHSRCIARQTTVKEYLFGWLQLVMFRRKQQTPQSVRKQQMPQSVRTIASLQQQFLMEELSGLLGHKDMNNFLQTTRLSIELKEKFFYWEFNTRFPYQSSRDGVLREAVNARMKQSHLQLSIDITMMRGGLVIATH